MSYDITLHCGCTVCVYCHPETRGRRTRVIKRRSATCGDRRHEAGARLWLWELLPRVSACYRARPEGRRA